MLLARRRTSSRRRWSSGSGTARRRLVQPASTRPGVPVEVVDEAFCRELFDDPDAERDAAGGARHGRAAVGRFEDPGLLVTFGDTPGVVQRGPSMCGEHTRELLAELGYTDAEIDALAEARAILDAPVTPS